VPSGAEPGEVRHHRDEAARRERQREVRAGELLFRRRARIGEPGGGASDEDHRRGQRARLDGKVDRRGRHRRRAVGARGPIRDLDLAHAGLRDHALGTAVGERRLHRRLIEERAERAVHQRAGTGGELRRELIDRVELVGARRLDGPHADRPVGIPASTNRA
jgi:hypothetical protein